MNALGKLAIVFIVVGAMLLTGPAFAFTFFESDRSISISTASGSDAILGVNPITETIEIRGDDSAKTVGTLINNLDQRVTVTDAEIVSIGGENIDDNVLTLQSPNAKSTTISGDGGEQAVQITCAEEESVNEQPVRIRVGVSDEAVTVTNVTFTVSVNIRCGQGQFSGAANFEADDIDTSQDELTQRFRVNIDALGNQDEAYIDLTDPQENGDVDYTGSTVNIVSGHKDREFFFDENSNMITFVAQGNPSGTLEIEISGFEVTGVTGGAVTYSELIDGEAGRTDGDTFSIVYVVSGDESVNTDKPIFVESGETADDINTSDDVTTGQYSDINGDISAGGDVSIGSDGTTNDIESGGSVTISNNVNVNGDIIATGDVIIGEEITAENIVGEGDVIIRDGSIINGNVTGNTVTLEDGATVNGEITETG